MQLNKALTEHSPASAMLGTVPGLGSAQHPLKGTKRKCKEGDNKTLSTKAKCPDPWVLSALNAAAQRCSCTLSQQAVGAQVPVQTHTCGRAEVEN